MITGYAFNNHLENGGDGLKIRIVQVQVAKIAKKTMWKTTEHEDGSLRYDGDIKLEAAYIYVVDMTITGSSIGTSSYQNSHSYPFS